MRHGVSSGGRRGVRATPGPSCCGCSPATPRSRWSHVTADSNAGAPVATLYPSLAPAYPHLDVRALRPRRRSTGSTSCSSRSRTASPSARCPSSSTTSATSSTSAPTSGSRPTTTRTWYGEPHGAPELLEQLRVRAARAVPRRPHAPTRHVAAPGCYPTAAALALAPLLARGLVEPDRHRRRRGVGRLRARARALARRACSPRRTRTSRRTGCSRTATPARSSTRSATSHGADVQVLFTPHLVPMTRGILATCHARPAVERPHHASAPRRVPRALRRRAVRGRRRRAAARRRRRSASNACHVTVRYDARTGTVLALAALDNLVKGAVGPGDPGAEPRARPARDRPASRPSGSMP